MATIWKSKTTENTITGTTLSSWSRQQKFAMIAGFVILGLLLGISACSKQSAKPALVSLSTPATTTAAPAVTATAAVQPAPTVTKKAHRKRPANVTYRDVGSGLSFMYPRQFEVTTGEKAEPQFGEMGKAPMNFVQPGGITVATVTIPEKAYPGTDFTTAFFNVNLNRNLTEAQCSQFAFVDKRDADGQAQAPEKVTIGSKNMNLTDDFSANTLEQAEAKYYHSYENGDCYEYVLGLGTAGYGTGTVDPVDRDQVFKKLEKIMATVKVHPDLPVQEVPEQQLAKQPPASVEPAKTEDSAKTGESAKLVQPEKQTGTTATDPQPKQ
jgi:hypothetical protein